MCKEVNGYICNIETWNGLTERMSIQEGIDTKSAIKMEDEYRRAAIKTVAQADTGHVLYGVIQHDPDLDIITTVSWFKNTILDDEGLDELIYRFPWAEFRVIHVDGTKRVCRELLARERQKEIRPITLKAANAFVKEHHRHHDTVTGCRFSEGLYKVCDGKSTLIGVAICGRPVSRILDDGLTLEINRLCVEEQEENACSMLYGACCRVAKAMGYKKVITYILESESGVSLKASNFMLDDSCCGGTRWTGKRSTEHIENKRRPPAERKQRWVKYLA